MKFYDYLWFLLCATEGSFFLQWPSGNYSHKGWLNDQYCCLGPSLSFNNSFKLSVLTHPINVLQKSNPLTVWVVFCTLCLTTLMDSSPYFITWVGSRGLKKKTTSVFFRKVTTCQSMDSIGGVGVDLCTHDRLGPSKILGKL